jgi:hypothetical protein
MSKFAVADLKLPREVEVKRNKTAMTFRSGNKKAVLKGRSLEVSHPTKKMGRRLEVFSKEAIDRCHLGVIKGIIRGIQDSVDLSAILNKYFSVL